ncbi:MAG: hypothetical protein IPG07_00725 [Crocinitomicaceae bacterium]|nr:hypothetical protein [Crocinitomicaceae bacterium]
MPNSEFKISFQSNEDFVYVDFDMISLKVEPEEIEKSSLREVSGHWSQELDLAGDGIGMYVIQKLVGLNGGKVEFKASYDKGKAMKYNNVPYENNKIIIALKK